VLDLLWDVGGFALAHGLGCLGRLGNRVEADACRRPQSTHAFYKSSASKFHDASPVKNAAAIDLNVNPSASFMPLRVGV
jgi:hypothetical protein